MFPPREIRPPNPRSKATVCAVTTGNIAELAALIALLVVLLSIRTIGYKGEQCNGGESGIRTHGTVSRTHAFQACALSHSAISPEALLWKGRRCRVAGVSPGIRTFSTAPAPLPRAASKHASS